MIGSRVRQRFVWIVALFMLDNGCTRLIPPRAATPLILPRAATTTTITSTHNPAVVGELVTIKATVRSSAGIPTGSVQFSTAPCGSSGTSVPISGAVQLNTSGVAALDTPNLQQGCDVVLAAYSGDGAFYPSNSRLPQVVTPSNTTTGLATTGNPSNYGSALTLQATVNSAAGAPVGSVDFLDSGVSIGTRPLSGGMAALSTSTLGLGKHELQAEFLPANPALQTSYSNVIAEIVDVQSATTLSTNANPALLFSPVVFSATVSGSAGTPTGSVSFLDGTTVLGNSPLSGGASLLTVRTLGPGMHTISANYIPDPNDPKYATSTGGPLSQQIFPGNMIVPTDNDGHYSPGPAEGRFGPSSDGAAIYTFPIWVPEGRRGIQPTLALVYDSRQSNGLLGVGWSLQGLSSISRCKRDMARDGVNAAVQFVDDPYCWDGQRLVESGNSVGSSFQAQCGMGRITEYRTEEDRFVRVLSGTWDTDNLGPMWFEADFKDGRIFCFGTTPDSRLEGLRFHSSPGNGTTLTTDFSESVRLSWAIAEVRDRFGNNLTVTYSVEGDPKNKVGFEQLPTTIQYTGTVDNTLPYALPPSRTVTFNYEARCDASQPGCDATHCDPTITTCDTPTTFVSGLRLQTRHRLKSIVLSAPSPITPATVRVYNLTYQQSVATGRSLLSSITECDAAGVCLAPTNLDYSTQDTDFFLDVNTHIHDDLASGETIAPVGHVLGPITVGDFDGDGCDDFIYTAFDEKSALQRAVYRLSSCYDAIAFGAMAFPPGSPDDSGFQLSPDNGAPNSHLPAGVFTTASGFDCQANPTNNYHYSCDSRPLLAVDLDLDGRADLVKFSNAMGNPEGRVDQWEVITDLSVYLASSIPPGQWTPAKPLFGGLTHFSTDAWVPTDQQQGFAPSNYFSVALGDISGDGSPDVLTMLPLAWSYQLNFGRSLIDPPLSNCDIVHGKPCLNLAAPSALFWGDAPVQGSDSNGHRTNGFTWVNATDILADGTSSVILRYPNQNAWDAAFSVVGGTSAPHGVNLALQGGESFDPHRRDWFVDLNGDGLPDSVSLDYLGGNPWVALNTGNGFEAPQQLSVDVPPPRDNLLIFDYKGDGTQDIVYTSATGMRALQWRDGALSSTPLLDQNHNQIPAGNDLQAFDANGDGLTDLIQVLNHTIHVYLRQGKKRDLLINVNDRGAITAINYAPITSAATYQTTVAPGVVSSSGSTPFSPSTTYVLNRGPWVVSGYTAPAPGSAGSAHKLAYTDGRTSLAGRGWLGFATVANTDLQTGVVTTTTYDNSTMVGTAYPFAMKPLSQLTHIPLSDLVSKEFLTTTSYFPPDPHCPGGGIRCAHIAVLAKEVLQTEKEFTATTSAGPLTPALLRSFDTTFKYDPYGNTTNARRTTGDGYSDSWAATYQYNVTQWLVANVSLLTETSSTPVGSYTQSTQYDPDLTLGVTKSQTIESYRKTNYHFDTHGVLTALDSNDLVNHEPQRTATIEYDPLDDIYPTSVTNVLRQTIRLAVHPGLGVTVARQDLNGAVDQWQYDGFGRLKQILAADGNNASTSYTGLCSLDVPACRRSYLVDTRYASGRNIEIQYDPSAIELVHDSSGFDGRTIRLKNVYNSEGLITNHIGPCFPRDSACFGLHRTQYVYDNSGRLASLQRGDGSSLQWSYTGLKTMRQDEVGNRHYIVEDQLGHVTQSTAIVDGGREISTTFSYEPFGYVYTVTDANGNVVRTTHDVRGRPWTLNDPDAGYHEYHWSSFDELYTEIYGNNLNRTGSNLSRTYHRDPIGRVLTITDADGTTTFNWDTAPNGIGKIANATSTDGVVTAYSYTPVGQLRTSTWSVNGDDYPFSFTYDRFGRLYTLTYPSDPSASGQPRYAIYQEYNRFSFPVRITDQNRSTLWQIDTENEFGEITKEEFGNHLITQRDYDARGRVARILTSGGAAQDLTFTYFPNGSLKCRLDRLPSMSIIEHFFYDPLDRLKDWTAAARGLIAFCNMPIKRNFLEETFVYDDIGNLKQRSTTTGSGPNLTYQYAQSGQYVFGPHAITQVNTDSYQYLGPEGDQSSGPDRTVAYKTFNLPTSVTDSNNNSTSFAYDADQRRVSTRYSSGDTTTSIGGLFERRVQKDGQSSLIFYLPGAGRIVGQVQPSQQAARQTLYLHNDNLGSIQAVTDNNGTTLARLWYEPFGQSVDPGTLQTYVTPPSSDVTLGFTGHIEERNLHLTDMKGRIYDPRLGHFLSADPIVQDPLRSESLNPYCYAWNNPVKWVDPTGFQTSGVQGQYDPSQGQISGNPGSPYFFDAGALTPWAIPEKAQSPTASDNGVFPNYPGSEPSRQSPAVRPMASGATTSLRTQTIPGMQPKDRVVIIITRDYGVGDHAALWLANHGHPLLYDPNGSYGDGKGEEWDPGESRVFKDEQARLRKYIAFQKGTGSDVETYRFWLSPQDEQGIIERIDPSDQSNGIRTSGYFSCAEDVCSAIRGIGPFADLPDLNLHLPTAYLSHIALPGSLADELKARLPVFSGAPVDDLLNFLMRAFSGGVFYGGP